MKTFLQWKNFWPQTFIKISVLMVLGCWCSSMAQAQGTLTWNWSFSNNSGDGGSGTLTTGDTLTMIGGNMGYLITGITGTWGSPTAGIGNAAITGVINGFDSTSPDNLLLASAPQLDSNGFAFTTANSSGVNIFYGLYGISSYGFTQNFGTYIDGTDGFTTTLASPTPEPATSALMIMAVGGLFMLGRLKLRPV